jgi:hypothetical protein
LRDFTAEISGVYGGAYEDDYILGYAETSVTYYQTTRLNIPEDTHLHELQKILIG